MDTRKILEQHGVTLSALLRGGVRRGVGGTNGEDDLVNSLQGNWETEHRLVRRVLRGTGDPEEQLLAMRTRTEEFLDKYPEREGWKDSNGEFWNAQRVLDGIDKLLEEIETRQMEDEEFFEDEEDEVYEE